MGPMFSFFQVMAGSSDNHFLAVSQKIIHHFQQVKKLGLLVNNGQHDDAERRLQGGVLVKVIENNFWYLSPFDFNHHPDSLPIRFITDIGYPLNFLGVDQFSNVFEESGFVDPIRYLGYNYFVFLASFSTTFNRAFGSQVNNAFAFLISLADVLAVKNITTCGEIRPRNKFHNVIQRGLGMINQINQTVTDLSQIVRRNVTGHADRNSR